MPEKKAPLTSSSLNDPELAKRAKILVAKVLVIGVIIGVVGFTVGIFSGYSMKVKNTHFLEVDFHELKEAQKYIHQAANMTTLIMGAIEDFQTKDLKYAYKRWKPEYALSVSYKRLKEAEDYLWAYEKTLSKQIKERWDEVRTAKTKKLSKSQ